MGRIFRACRERSTRTPQNFQAIPLARPAGLEPATRGLEEPSEATQSEGLRDVGSSDGVEGSDRDPACFSVHQDDSSRIVTEKSAECTSDIDLEAVLARALAHAADAGRFDIVAQLARELEARRLALAGNVVDLGSAQRRGRK
jgi:hypothetical protein